MTITVSVENGDARYFEIYNKSKMRQKQLYVYGKSRKYTIKVKKNVPIYIKTYPYITDVGTYRFKTKIK